MSDPAEVFQAELVVLRDRVIRAARDDKISDLKDGLDLYSRLVTTVIDEFRKYETITDTGGLGIRSFYGREMSWLDDDIATFIRTASVEPAGGSIHEVLSFLLGLLINAFNRRELAAFGSFLEKYRVAWYSAKHEGSAERWHRIRGSILLALENFGDFWISRELRRSTREVEPPTPYAQRLVSELSQLMKYAVDDGSTDDLRAAATTLQETMRPQLKRIEQHFESEAASDSAGSAFSITKLKGAAVLAVEGWILFRTDADRTDPATANSLIKANREVAPISTWFDYLAAKYPATGDLLGWSRWETGLWEHRRAGFLKFETEGIDRAFALRLIDGYGELPSTSDTTTTGSRYQLESLA